MPRPVSLLPALVAAAALVGSLGGSLVAGASPAAAAPVGSPHPGQVVTADSERAATRTAPGRSAGRPAAPQRRLPTTSSPLAVTIDSLTPSALPRSGPVRVSGSVTNLDDQPWMRINLYSFVSDAPMTSAEELAAAAETPEEAFVGSRITDPAPYDTITELQPGESAQYSMSVPRRRIHVTAAGVYWFGVHALGESTDGRDDVADGRARTFLPLVPRTARPVDTAIVVPVRRPVRHEPDGRVARVPAWADTLSSQGALRRLTDLGVAAGDRPLTWLVDPAVVDAVSRLAAGNPDRTSATAGRTAGPGDAPSGSPSPSASPGDQPPSQPTDASTGADAGDDAGDESGGDAGSAAGATSPAASDAAADDAVIEAARSGAAWLARLHTGLEGAEVLGLPYGDLDVAGAAEHDPEAYRRARARTGSSLAPWRVPITPAVAAPSGYLPPSALRLLTPETRALVSDRMFEGPTAPVASALGHDLVVTSPDAATGGPGPDDPLSVVGMRQRILSEAALRTLDPRDPPLVLTLPSDWAPASSAGFFEGLDVPWLRLVTVDDIAGRTARPVDTGRLVYPETERAAELNAVDFANADELIRAGATLQNVLTDAAGVAGRTRDEALTDVSYAARRAPARARGSAYRSRQWVQKQLGSVTVEAPPGVILSSGSGRFSAVVSNGLDQPVTVRLTASTDRRMRISTPASDVQVGPHSRTTILLNASSRSVGVHNVSLLLTDTSGTPIGSSDALPIRSNQVSKVIWLILGAGITLLLATIVLRLVRRIRGAARS